MGKSTVAKMFAKAGLPVFDADAEVHRLQGPGGGLAHLIEKRFPGSTRGGSVDREALSLHVLGKPDGFAALEAIVHPAVQAARRKFEQDHDGAAALLFEIPLLFETYGQTGFDKIVVVSAPEDVQRARVLARPGMTPAKLEAILERQMPDAEKRSHADFVVNTGGDLSTVQAQVDSILTCLGLSTGR
jgi:dephospho-CoA kinase